MSHALNVLVTPTREPPMPSAKQRNFYTWSEAGPLMPTTFRTTNMWCVGFCEGTTFVGLKGKLRGEPRFVL